MSNFSPSLSTISRMKFSSLTSQAASLCKSDVNVYSVCLSLLFLIIIRIINPFHKHLPVINSGSIKDIGKSHLSIRGSQLELVSATNQFRVICF